MILHQRCYQPYYINSLSLGKYGYDFKCLVFKCHWVTDIENISHVIVIEWMPNNHTDDNWHTEVNIGSGNGLVPDGNKPLPEPALT